jgi:1-acyl-sn-glycerol-3-phosphate acyltransferase
MEPLLDFLYDVWWRVEVDGMEHVPGEGGALMVVNHSGVLPFDQLMLLTAVRRLHPKPRPVRGLHLKWLSTVPLVAPLSARTGHVPGLPENAERLLSDGHLASVYPEGIKGIAKPFKERYRLARFGRGGYVKAALATGAPIVPAAVVGAEETYPMLGRIPWVEKLLNIPYFPITPTFPWLGALGFLPLPSKWHIEILPPVRFRPGCEAFVDDLPVVQAINDQVRGAIQQSLARRVVSRRSIWR